MIILLINDYEKERLILDVLFLSFFGQFGITNKEDILCLKN